MTGSGAAARVVGVVLAVQLTTAAGALAGPWAVVPPAPVAEPPALARQPAPVRVVDAGSAAPASREVALSAPGLWDGTVPLTPLQVDGAGVLDVPATAAELGWWAAGPRPGDDGAAVVVGHVDLDGRPGVLSRLAQAAPGTVVVARRPDGDVRFVVTRVARYGKAAFPTDEVYRPVDGPELRLITCGGRFDRTTGHYEDNVVLTAVRLP